MLSRNTQMGSKGRMIKYICNKCDQDFTSDDVRMAYSSSVACCPNCGSEDISEDEEEVKSRNTLNLSKEVSYVE